MSKLYRLGLWLIPILLLGACALHAQASQQNSIRFSSLADGFKNAPVTSYGLAQDQQGFLWLANELDGLQRFDGYQLEEFMVLPPSASEKLSISSVMVDSRNRIWIGTWSYGLVMLSEDRRQRQHWQQAGTLAHPADSQKGNLDQIQTTFEDQQQRLWVGTTTGVYFINAQLQQQSIPAALQQFLGKTRIWQINQGQDGQLWFACSEGLLQVSSDLSSQQFWSLQQVEYANKTSRYLEVRTVLPVANGAWLATNDGLFFLDTAAKVIKPLPHHMAQLTRSNKLTFSPQGQLLIATSDGLYQLYAPFSYRQQLTKLLHAVDVRDVLSDGNGLMWLATRNRGVFKLSVREDSFTLLTNDRQHSYFEHGLSRIVSQYYHQGTLWLGLEHAVLSFDMAQKQWKSHPFPDDSLVSLVTGLTVDPNGETWAATNTGLFRLEGNKGFTKEPRPFSRFNDHVDISLMSLSHSADGTLNIGTWQQGLIRWQPDTPELPGTLIAVAQNQSDGIQQSAVAPDGTIWLTSFRSGLYRLDPENLSTTHYSVAKSSSPILPTNNLPCITVLNNNEVWLCSDNGLLKLDVQHQQLTQWTTADGLPDQRVIAIDARSADSLWLSTRRGLAKFNYQTKKIRSFVEQDGIPSLLLEPRALSSDANGNYYLGTLQPAC